MAEHAPTPWGRDEYDHIIDAKGKPVALFGLHVSMAAGSDRNSDYMQEARANTDLFFAAPDLLAAAEMLERAERLEIEVGHCAATDGAYREARTMRRAAIEKAYGRQATDG